MKRIITIIFLSLIYSDMAFAQSQNVTSAAILLKQYNSEKDKSVKELKITEAKELIDKAFLNEKTSNEPKMWMYRAKIYLKVAFNHNSLDPNAIFKATESHIKCMQPHPKKKKKIIIYKRWSEDEVLEGLIQCGAKLFEMGVNAYQEKNYSNAISYYNRILDVLPFDEEGQLKRMNISKETIYLNSYLASKELNDNNQSKEFLQFLIDANFNDPRIYAWMSNIYLDEKNSDKAIEYLSSGREMYDTDEYLIGAEINLYIKLERTEDLVGKLSAAIEIDPENERLLLNRANIYFDIKNIESAEKDYEKVLSIDPANFTANYILGVINFNKATDAINRANATSNNSTYNRLKKESDNYYQRALPYIVRAAEIDPNHKENLTSLKELYYRIGDYVKSEEVKKQIAAIK